MGNLLSLIIIDNKSSHLPSQQNIYITNKSSDDIIYALALFVHGKELLVMSLIVIFFVSTMVNLSITASWCYDLWCMWIDLRQELKSEWITKSIIRSCEYDLLKRLLVMDRELRLASNSLHINTHNGQPTPTCPSTCHTMPSKNTRTTYCKV